MNYPVHNQKFKSLVNTATILFWKYGIKRITIGEICHEANVSKMTFYKFFNNKTELARYVLEAKMNAAMSKYRKIMDADMPFVKKVEMSVKLKMDQTQDISQELLTDLYRNPNPEILEFFESKKKDLLNQILADYKNAQTAGHIRKNIKPEFILYFLNHMFEMVKDKELFHMYPNAQELIMELTNFFFYGIMTGTYDRK